MSFIANSFVYLMKATHHTSGSDVSNETRWLVVAWVSGSGRVWALRLKLFVQSIREAGRGVISCPMAIYY